MADGRGLPLLSGPPPPHSLERAETSCRKCNKEFNIIFSRAHKCNHCGYSYCNSCSDFQALMPRGSQDPGYDVVPVCAYCIENLTVTAGGRGHLRSLPLGKLKKYVEAYNIKVGRALEKDDLIDSILAARERNGCLPRANEEFYRKYSVPIHPVGGRQRGLFSRLGDPPSAPTPVPPRPNMNNTTQNAFPRPDLDSYWQQPEQPQQSQYAPPPPPRRQASHQPSPPQTPRQSRPQNYQTPRTQTTHHQYPNVQPSHQSHQYHTFPQQSHPYQNPQQNHNHSRSSTNLNVPGPGGPGGPSSSPPQPVRQRAASATPAPSTSPPPVPTLTQLLDMTSSAVSALSISTLKAILFQNHVNAGMIIEKGELVLKVKGLLEEERKDRERDAEIKRREEAEEQERQRERLEELRRQKDKKDGKVVDSGESMPLPPKAQAMAATLERDGLCVICQDDEANIAIVDCGHLAMCRECSDLVMTSSRECPLCRTRIVTEARLLRIFKT